MAQPLYQQAAEDIRGMILSGAYKPGEQIPTEMELASQMQMSRPTIRQALDVLSREGYLIRIKGSGTFVSQPKLMHDSTSFITSYKEEAAKKQLKMCTSVISLSLETPDEDIRSVLKLKPHHKVIVLARTRCLEQRYNGAPVAYSVVHVPYHLFPEMLTVDFTAESFYDILAQKDMKIVRARKRLEVIQPGIEIASILEISSFEPVVMVTTEGCDKDGRIIEYSFSYYPASRSSFHIEVTSPV